MIAEECRTLRNQLEELAQAEARQGIVEQLESRHEVLVTLRDSVVTATSALCALAARTTIVGDIDGSKARDRLQTVRAALNDDPQRITKGRDFTNMKSALEKFADAARQATENTWNQYVSRVRPTINKDQLKEAELQDAFKLTVQKLESSTTSADRISRKPPANEDEFAALEAAWEEIRDLIEELPAAASDPAIREFLKAANSQRGASLDLLTDAVRQWLADNETTDRYRIFGV
jgi:hypothetical protein